MTAIVRTPFTTSRLLEFCTVPELTKLVGFEPVYWPVVVVKEISDNALDACEEAGIAPEIIIAISTKTGTISITDNGPGIPPDTVYKPLDVMHDSQVLTFVEWCRLNRLSERTGRRILDGPNPPTITDLSARRIGITVRNNRLWQASRERG